MGCWEDNVRRVLNLLEDIHHKRITSALYFIDMDKVFATVEWDFTKYVMEAMNFGLLFQAWFKLIYAEKVAITWHGGL